MTMNVLLATQSETMLELLTLSLKAADVDQFVVATDGDEALDQFDTGSFDLVLANWDLPGKSGLDVLKAIRAAGSQLPVILISNQVDEDEIMAAVEAGVSEFLTRPFAAESRVYLENILRSMGGKALRMARRPRMNVEYINPYLTSTLSVFESMLNWSIKRGEPFLSDSYQPEHHVSGVVTLAGSTEGTFVLSFSRKAALRALVPVMGRHPTQIDADVIDVICELTNIIAGHAQAQFEESGLTMSPPEIKVGRSHAIDFPEGVKANLHPIRVPMGPGDRPVRSR